MKNHTLPKGQCIAEIIPWCPDCGERFEPIRHMEVQDVKRITCAHCGAEMRVESEMCFFVTTAKSKAAEEEFRTELEAFK
jgi:hypothetical protein